MILKAMVGMVVICFFGVGVLLAIKGQIEFRRDFGWLSFPISSQWFEPAPVAWGSVFASLPRMIKSFGGRTDLSAVIVSVMIAAYATAVGINMTFLLPYSMLSRGWDKPFRGLATVMTFRPVMAIPYVLVTSCVVIAAACLISRQD